MPNALIRYQQTGNLHFVTFSVQLSILFFPLLQTPPAGRRRWIFVRKKSPRRPGPQHPNDAFQAGPGRRRRPAQPIAATFRLRYSGSIRDHCAYVNSSNRRLLSQPVSQLGSASKSIYLQAEPLYETAPRNAAYDMGRISKSIRVWSRITAPAIAGNLCCRPLLCSTRPFF